MATSYNSRLSTAPEEGVKAPVIVAADANITLSGEQTLGATAVTAGDRVIVNSQTDNTENGIYVVGTGAWERSTDFNAADDVLSGQLVVASATSKLYKVGVTGSWTPGTTPISFSLFPSEDVKEFETLAAAKASTSLVVGDLIRTMGHTTAGDGGANDYKIVAAGTYTHDNGRYVDLATHQAEGLFPRGYYCVQHWGATGDGSTDDTTALQAAIDATTATGSGLASGSIALHWGAGKFKVTSSLTLDGDFRWIGEGKNGTWVTASGSFSELISLPDSILGDTNTTSRSYARGIRFDGGGVCDYSIKGYSNSCSFYECWFSGANTIASDISYGWSIRYIGCEFSYNGGDGMHVLGSGANFKVAVIACVLFNNTGAGGVFGSNQQLAIQNCVIETNAKVGLFGVNSAVTSLTDNYFESNGTTGWTFTTPAETVKAQIILSGSQTSLAYNPTNNNAMIDRNTFTGNMTTIYAAGMKGGSIRNNMRVGQGNSVLLKSYGNVGGALTYGYFNGVDIGGNIGFGASYTGTHDGSTSSTVMTDSTASFTTDFLIGSIIYNKTDRSSAIITDNDATTVTVASLAGGSDDQFRRFTGTHTGSNNVATLADSGNPFTASSLEGARVYNTTDGANAQGIITANTISDVTAVMKGGTDNDWDNGDAYVIEDQYVIVVPEIQLVNIPLSGTGSVLGESHNFGGIRYREASHQNIAEQDMNQWTLFTGSGGTYQRSAEVFDRNPYATVWEIDDTVGQDSATYGFTIDTRRFANLAGKLCRFELWIKHEFNNGHTGNIQLRCGGATSTPETAGPTDEWRHYGVTFRMPADNDGYQFSINKKGNNAGKVYFSCPSVHELGSNARSDFHTREQRRQFRGSAAPTNGTWVVGDIVWNTSPDPSTSTDIAWVYSSANAWEPWGDIGT